jgi:polar amino acid transport system permease protein
MDFQVVWDNLSYFFVGRYPKGPLGGVGLTLYLAWWRWPSPSSGGWSWGVEHFPEPGDPVGLLLVHPDHPRDASFDGHLLDVLPAARAVREGDARLDDRHHRAHPVHSAYMSEIVRAGIMGIPKGQTEAAESTGLTHRQTMLYVILPQALRNMIPSFVNQFVSMIKDTSLAFIVGVAELTQIATQVNNRTMMYPTEIFMFIAVIYFIMCFAFTELSRWLERRLAYTKSI